MQDLGRTLILIGLVIAVVGAVFYFSGRANLPIGRLPGDITYRKGNFLHRWGRASCSALS